MIIDWLIIFLYLIGITLIGIRAVKKVKTASGFFITGRKIGKTMMMFFTF